MIEFVVSERTALHFPSHYIKHKVNWIGLWRQIWTRAVLHGCQNPIKAEKTAQDKNLHLYLQWSNDILANIKAHTCNNFTKTHTKSCLLKNSMKLELLQICIKLHLRSKFTYAGNCYFCLFLRRWHCSVEAGHPGSLRLFILGVCALV